MDNTKNEPDTGQPRQLHPVFSGFFLGMLVGMIILMYVALVLPDSTRDQREYIYGVSLAGLVITNGIGIALKMLHRKPLVVRTVIALSILLGIILHIIGEFLVSFWAVLITAGLSAVITMFQARGTNA